jgi:tetraacyldisaccharide 4'-kinase
VESRHAPREVLDGTLGRSFGLASLAGRRVLLLSGLARPEGFRASATALGAVVAAERAFPDHHVFTGAELDEAFAAAMRAGCDLVLTTEKDAMRLPAWCAGDGRLRVLRIDAEVVAGEEVLDAALRGCFGRNPASPAPTSTPPPTWRREP